MSQLFTNQETKLNTSLRSRTHTSFKNNFSNLYNGHIQCPLNCWLDTEDQEIDSQEHLLDCTKVLKEIKGIYIVNEKVNYIDIFGTSTKKQK